MTRLGGGGGTADSGGGGFKRYFEEIAIVLKSHFPDVLINREIVEVGGMGIASVAGLEAVLLTWK